MTFPQPTATKLDAIAARYARRNDTSDVSLALLDRETGHEWHFRAADAPERYFIASTTKLFTAAIIFQLIDEGALTLTDLATDVLGQDVMRGLATYRGRDHSAEVTIEHLLSHASGIPDYFEGTGADGTSLFQQILRADYAWERASALDRARAMPAANAPGQVRKALYSDTNYQLLHLIIESRGGESYARAVERRIAAPLGLSSTFVFTPERLGDAGDIAALLNGTTPLVIPRAMASFGADGSVVSTAPEQLVFFRAYLDGRLFDPEWVDRALAPRHRIFPPFRYGLGTMRFQLPPPLSWASKPGPLVGHSGASGVALFATDDRRYIVAGAVNQVRKRGMVFRAVSQLIAAAA